MTPDDYATEFCNSNDVPFATDSKKYRALVRTIAAAVAEEREECAELAKSMIGATRHEIAAAIRARK